MELMNINDLLEEKPKINNKKRIVKEKIKKVDQ